jgi:hypothetical protein
MHSHLRTTALAALAVLGLGTASASATVVPISVDEALDPGGSMTITKTVTTPEIPPRPDIVLLVDRTGSMFGAIDNVKTNMSSLVAAVEAAAPDAQWAVASYCDDDLGEPDPFLLHSDLSDDTTTTVNAVNGITLCNGGDGPEAQLNALWEIGDGGDAVSFREGSTRIVVWFGDAPGHDPSLGHTEADATGSLTAADIQALAVSVGANQLDSTGQATRITTATGGTFYPGVTPEELSATILAGLTNLPVEVGASATCDTGLTAALEPATLTVTSGEDAVFVETLTLAGDAPQGETLTCEVEFTLNGEPGGAGFVQSVSVHVNDVLAPVVSCKQGPNPAGRMPQGGDPDGFFQLSATDNVDDELDIYVHDTGSDAVFGPYANGSTFKITQAPGATPQETAGTGAVDWRLRLQGDALVTVTDAAGNIGTATCEVPPAG